MVGHAASLIHVVSKRRIVWRKCGTKFGVFLFPERRIGTAAFQKKKKKAGKVTSTRPPAIKAQFLLAPTALPHWPAILKYILCTTTYIQVCV